MKKSYRDSKKMNSLSNFFDHPLEKKISAMKIQPPEISPPEKYFGLDSVNRIANCPCDLLWLDAYGVWRCKKCFPPIFESEVRKLKKRSEENPPSKISPVENLPAQEILPSEIFIIPPCDFDPFEFLASPPQEKCEKCGSLDFWWNILDERHCQRCHPRPKRSRELLELAPRLRALAKTVSPAKK